MPRSRNRTWRHCAGIYDPVLSPVAKRALPVLMYHGLHSDPYTRGVFDSVYSVCPKEFALQLDWLADNGYRTVLLRDLDREECQSPCVLISFDDGDISNLEIALPLLAERRMVAEFFVTADFVGQPGRLGAADARALAAAGMGVQSHGFSHSYLDELSPAELDRELSASKHRLEAIVGEPVTALALPGGRGGERERIAALRLGYQDVLNSEPGHNRHRTRGSYFQRLAITRELSLVDFAKLVKWQGFLPRAMQLRYHALARLKRALGTQRYERFRKRMLQR